jgi:hypothetical protein
MKRSSSPGCPPLRAAAHPPGQGKVPISEIIERSILERQEAMSRSRVTSCGSGNPLDSRPSVHQNPRPYDAIHLILRLF